MRVCARRLLDTANLRTKILDFSEFDSSRILILRGGIPRPIGNFPESLSQAILSGTLSREIVRIGHCTVSQAPAAHQLGLWCSASRYIRTATRVGRRLPEGAPLL